MFEDCAGAVLHRRICRTEHVVGIDDYVCTPFAHFRVGHVVVGRWHDNDGNSVMHLTKSCYELMDVFAGLVLAVYHDTVGAGFYVSVGTFQSFLHGVTGYKAFDAGYNHKVGSDLCPLSGSDFIAEMLYGVELLLCGGAEKRVLLQPYLILYNDG